MSIHPCLSSSEVFSNILKFVNAERPDRGDPFDEFGPTKYNPTLAALARTCKTFLEPALDMLWHTLFEASPLARLFPADVWLEEEVVQELERPSYCLYPTRFPTASEWSRFDYYAHRVRELGHLRNELPDMQEKNLFGLPGGIYRRRRPSEEFMRVLCLSRHRTSLLPNLAKFRWNPEDGPWTDLLPMLIAGPRFTSLSLGACTTSDDAMIAPVIAALLHICPQTTELEIFTTHPQSVFDAAVEFAYRCPRLEAFVVAPPEPWPKDFLYHLAVQPYLRKVYLHIDAETASDLLSLHYAIPHYPFQSLTKLWLEIPSIEDATWLIWIMQTCRLHTIDVTVSRRLMPTHLSQFFETIRATCELRSLQIIEIQGPMEPEAPTQEEEEEFFSWEYLEPLLDFPNMRRFRLRNPVFVVSPFDNSAIRRIADSWPLILDLRIGAHGFFAPPKITWAGIAYLLYKCPELVILYISFNSTVNDVEDVTALPDFRPNRNVRTIWLQDTILTDSVEDFARNLFAIAPLVLSINGLGYEATEIGIIPVQPASMFYPQVESILWELRRTQMREEFAFLDKYVATEADLMNDFANPLPRFPYAKVDGFHSYRRVESL